MIETQIRPTDLQIQPDSPSVVKPAIPNFTVQPPLLDTLLAEQGNLPAYSMLMGVCDDGLPLILDLTNPEAGSMLIIGGDEFYNTNLLHTLITSVAQTNTEKELNFHLVSPYVNQVVTFQQDLHYKLGFEPDHPDCNIVIEEFVRLVKSRQRGDPLTPMQVLGIDNLDQLLDNFSDDDISNLAWLIKNGPSFGVWVLATTTANHAKRKHSKIKNLFSSKIISQFSNPMNILNVPNKLFPHITKLVAGCEVFVTHKDTSRHIWIPQLEDLGFGRTG